MLRVLALPHLQVNHVIKGFLTLKGSFAQPSDPRYLKRMNHASECLWQLFKYLRIQEGASFKHQQVSGQ
jgi:hypothetical protein